MQEPTAVGRYLIFDEIGVGGMASVHLGLSRGAVGFRRIVAIKQLHARFVGDPDFVAQFTNEARLAARIHHANVVQTHDVVWTGNELLLVMEYVDGDTLNRVLKTLTERGEHIPIDVACSLISGVLNGLHAAHEVRDADGAPLNIVHRDVSPQNILIARDGVARVLDFGVAKAAAQGFQTESGLLKGKFGYMAPEQIMRSEVDRRTDVFAAGVVFWETLTRRRLFQTGKNVEQALSRLLSEDVAPPSTYRPELPEELDAIVMKAIDREPGARFQTAEAFAVAVEKAVIGASHHLVKSWFEPIASLDLARRARLVQSINKQHAMPAKVLTPNPGAMNKLSLPLPAGVTRIGPDEETRMLDTRAKLASQPSSRQAREPRRDPDVFTPNRLVSWPRDLPSRSLWSETPFGHSSSSLSRVSAAGVESRAPSLRRRPQLVAAAIVLLAVAAAAFVILLGDGDQSDAGTHAPPPAAAAAETPQETSGTSVATQSTAMPAPDASAPAASALEPEVPATPPEPTLPAAVASESPEPSGASGTQAPRRKNKTKASTAKPSPKKAPRSDLGLRPSR